MSTVVPSKRPVSLTIICWLIIIIGTVSIVTLPRKADTISTGFVVGTNVVHGIILASAVTNVVSGVSMLRGYNWGRLFFVIAKIILTVTFLVVLRDKAEILWGSLFLFVVVAALFRPAVTNYFASKV
jgi:hypothetical protein